MSNLEQARAIFSPTPKKIRGCDGKCSGVRCIEIHNLGTLNPPTFTGADYCWGPEAAGSLMGEWDIHGERYTRVYGYFSGGPFANGIVEDYTDAICE
jgi:hypothetical protein